MYECLFSEKDLAEYVDSPVLMAAEKYQLTILSMVSTPAWQRRQLQVIYTWMLGQNGALQKKISTFTIILLKRV